MHNRLHTNVSFSEPTRIDRVVCIATITFSLLVSLFYWWSRQGLWEDEIIAITHANQPFPLFFIEVLRNDVHPPMYFLQLKLWQQLGFHSDQAILANSLFWASISLYALFHMVRAVYGARAAWYAAAVYAIFPIFAYSAANLRMYAMVPAMAVLVWYANHRWFDTARNKWLVMAILVEVVLAYVHAIEFYFVAFLVMAAFADALLRRRAGDASPAVKRNAAIAKWLGWQAVGGVLMLPLMGSALIRGSDAGAPASGLAILLEPGALVAGWGPSSILSLRIAGLVIFCVLAVLAMKEPSGRLRTLIIPIGALGVAIAVSMLAKPMLKVPVFAANLLPFLALGAGVGVAFYARPWARGALYACLALLCAAAVPLVVYQIKPGGYQETAHYLVAKSQADDVVIVPNVSVYWGVLRYAAGSNWGKPLEVMPLEVNAQWASLTTKLGPEVTELLGLRPRTDTVTHNNVRYVIGQDARKATAQAKRIWVVHRDGYRVDVELGGPFVRHSMVRAGGGELVVSRFDSDPSGKTIARHPLQLDQDEAMTVEPVSAL